MTVKEVKEMLEQMMEKIGGRKVNVDGSGKVLYLNLRAVHVFDEGDDDDRSMIYIHNDDYSVVVELHAQRDNDDEWSTIESIELGDDGRCEIIFEDEDFGYITIDPINE